MSADRSPTYAQGCTDGKADRSRVESCPPMPPIGPTPPFPNYRRMYDRGYGDEFSQAVPHICTDKCRK